MRVNTNAHSVLVGVRSIPCARFSSPASQSPAHCVSGPSSIGLSPVAGSVLILVLPFLQARWAS